VFSKTISPITGDKFNVYCIIKELNNFELLLGWKAFEKVHLVNVTYETLE